MLIFSHRGCGIQSYLIQIIFHIFLKKKSTTNKSSPTHNYHGVGLASNTTKPVIGWVRYGAMHMPIESCLGWPKPKPNLTCCHLYFQDNAKKYEMMQKVLQWIEWTAITRNPRGMVRKTKRRVDASIVRNRVILIGVANNTKKRKIIRPKLPKIIILQSLLRQTL